MRSTRTRWRLVRESGQAIVMVMICAALLAIIAPVIVTQAVSTLSTTSQSVLAEDALAAAQAGVQQYRNYLDLNSNYFACSWQSDCGNVALDIGKWYDMQVTTGAPAEAFHYFPDPCFETQNSCGGGTGSAAILLTSTGRSGNPGDYVYRTIQVTLHSTGVLSNAYFSDYETLDGLQDTQTVDVENYFDVTGAKATRGGETLTGSFPGVAVGDTVDAYTEDGLTWQGYPSPNGTCTPTDANPNSGQQTNCLVVTGVTQVNLKAPPTAITVSYPAGKTGTFTLEIGGVTADTMQSAPQVPVVGSSQSLWQELCQYHTYDVNGFINSLYGTPNAQTDQPAAYYGPWRGGSPAGQNPDSDQFNYVFSGPPVGGGPAETMGALGACESPFNFVSGETFNGPVYSEDQIWVCGNPTFEAGLDSSEGPATWGADYSTGGWATYGGSGPNGTWIDNQGGAKTSDWDGSCYDNLGQSKPDFGVTPLPSQDEGLPPQNTALATAALNGGCYFTGPTIIEFVQGGYMDVWSPFSGVPGAQPVGGAACGSWPPPASADGFEQVTLPPPTTTNGGLVIYVANVPGTVATKCPTCVATAVSDGQALGALPPTDPNEPTLVDCPDPWLPYLASCPTLPNGDAIVEGELEGQVTVATAGSIVVSRDLSYECADATSVESQASPNYPGLPTSGQGNCNDDEPDILGLVAENDVVIGHPGATSPPTPSTTDDDQVPQQTEPGEWPTAGGKAAWCPTSQDGSEITQTTSAQTAIADGVPDCDVSNPVIDAAVLAINGSFADENWDMVDDSTAPGNPNGNYPQSAWLYGADVSDFRGPFACVGIANLCGVLGGNVTTGYDKEFTYDNRLSYLTPPSLLKIASQLWNSEGFVNCGEVNDNSSAYESDTSNFCPGLLRLGG